MYKFLEKGPKFIPNLANGPQFIAHLEQEFEYFFRRLRLEH